MQNRIGADNICPETKEPCLDECCSPGSVCNVSGSKLQPTDKGQEGEVSVTPEDVLDMHVRPGANGKSFKEFMPDVYKGVIRAMREYASREVLDYVQEEPATPQPVTGEEVELAKEYADKVMPFVWPKNKRGEDIQMLVGQKNPPFSAKHRRDQQKIIDAYLAGASSLQAENERLQTELNKETGEVMYQIGEVERVKGLVNKLWRDVMQFDETDDLWQKFKTSHNF